MFWEQAPGLCVSILPLPQAEIQRPGLIPDECSDQRRLSQGSVTAAALAGATPCCGALEKAIAPASRQPWPQPPLTLVSSSCVCFQGKFLAFYQYAKSFNSDDFDYEELKNGDYVFMRWKVSAPAGGVPAVRLL